MRWSLFAILACLALAASFVKADDRIASDFELRAAQAQLSGSRTAMDRVASHLNLGDTHLSRGDTGNARASYEAAAAIARQERRTSLEAGDLRQNATFTAYEGLAAAKLGRREDAFALLEASVRLVQDSPRLWNLYASAMQVAGMRAKAVTGARNAAMLSDPSAGGGRGAVDELDHLIHLYALASALEGGDSAAREEAVALLDRIVARLDSPAFENLRRQAADREQFEVFSTARGDVAAFLSLRARSKQRLAKIIGPADPVRAAEIYRSMLRDRSDDPAALAGLAQMSRATEDKRDAFIAAFDANPLSIPLIRDYEAFLAVSRDQAPDGRSAGSLMRRAVQLLRDGSYVRAEADLEELARRFPGSEAVAWMRARSLRARGRAAEAASLAAGLSDELQRDLERLAAPRFSVAGLSPSPSAEDLRAVATLLRSGAAAPEELRHLDQTVFTSAAMLSAVTAAEGQTIATGGTVEGMRFRFSEPMTFNGRFQEGEPLRLEYRISGAAREDDGSDTLLIDPVRISR